MIKIGDRIIGDNSPAFIIAEAGVNHSGSVELAKKMIDAAVEAGADAIKFQIFKAENLVIKSAEKAEYQKRTTGENESQYDMLKKLELTYDQHIELMKYCQQKRIIYLSTPFDFESADVLDKCDVAAYKIGSGDITNLPLIEYIARRNKPMIISTGMADLGEIEDAIDIIRKTGNEKIILLHCVSNYPADYRDVNLNAMLTLKNAFKFPVGYSDHTLGIEIPIAAVALGAKVIEKHFTLDRNLPGPDHKASLEPFELKQMIKSIRNVECSMGDGIKKCTYVEENARKVARKSLVAACDIRRGMVIEKEMLTVKRPGTGIPPKDIGYIVGRKAKIDILKDTLINLDMLE
ncbi:N-acetylneuraminate synthase [Caldanaerobius fijiensis DSM 17918]|uniref:N-acetylneuraminate synthase n=1 Tax=Caldanaerobius fijiensis DSM 17918 TaxID=1121256 RepID=A0A1M4V2R6_9THEO|nr:N-acetylneuraminate synthase [Caldanaerobius fijiensis]SHE63235.1 N-acetylneuraminate synthase [Caldanaerobius fijiensis DSM 17918]